MDYDKHINAAFWIQHGLTKVIEKYIEQNKITHIYGFFSKSTDYMRIMKSVDWNKLKDRSSLQLSRTCYINLYQFPR